MYGDYGSSAGNLAAGGAGIAWLLCVGIFGLIGLLLLILGVWMLVDVIQRQEYEFPNSTGSSKTLWLILLIAGLVTGFYWIIAPIYYFKIFKAVKRGTIAPPQQPYGQQYPPAYPQGYAPQAPQGYQPAPAQPAPPAYAPPAPPAYQPPAPPEPMPAPMPEPMAPTMEPPAEPPMAPPMEPPAEPPAE